MNKLLIATLLFFSFFSTAAQNSTKEYPKTISVTGSAEMEVAPDEIYVQVHLKEYEKKGTGKVGIDKIKADFLRHVKGMGIADSLVSIAAYDGTANPWLRKKNKKGELYAGIAYTLKLRSSAQVDALVNGLDDEATQNFFIERTAYSKMEELKKTLKMAAVKAAKEKATYLTAAIDEKLGAAVTINEPVEYFIPFYNQRAANMMVKGVAMEEAAADVTAVDFRKLKIKYDVSVTFAVI
jgi:uncharacterized protein YggE